MNCETASELLPELLSGKLGRETEMELLSHLAQCPECRGELAFWAQVAEAVDAEAVEAAMPAGLYKDVRARLFGVGAMSTLDGVRQAVRALDLVRSACRLALSTAGL